MASDQRHHLHPFQLFDTYLVDPALAVARGAGARLVDTDGNEYLDAVGGMWCTNIGLGREDMAAAIAKQVRDLAYANPFTDMTNVCAVELAERLASLAPGSLNHAFFTCGGSTANDAALRLVQYYWAVRDEPERRHILSRVDSYHGTTLAAASLSGKPGSGGVIMPPADYVAACHVCGGREFCRHHGILYVSDEVVTGFGRLGEWFVSESLYGIRPDILTTAKGLTSGYVPLGAMLFTDEIFDVISEPGHGRCFAVDRPTCPWGPCCSRTRSSTSSPSPATADHRSAAAPMVSASASPSARIRSQWVWSASRARSANDATWSANSTGSRSSRRLASTRAPSMSQSTPWLAKSESRSISSPAAAPSAIRAAWVLMMRSHRTRWSARAGSLSTSAAVVQVKS